MLLEFAMVLLLFGYILSGDNWALLIGGSGILIVDIVMFVRRKIKNEKLSN